MIVTDGTLDPGAPPPYELEELPTDNNEPEGPWQCTLHVAHIPEEHRGKARRDGEFNSQRRCKQRSNAVICLD